MLKATGEFLAPFEEAFRGDCTGCPAPEIASSHLTIAGLVAVAIWLAYTIAWIKADRARAKAFDKRARH